MKLGFVAHLTEKCSILIISLALMFLAGSAVAKEPITNSEPAFKLSEVVPTGECQVEVMAVTLGKRAKELEMRMQAAVATNQDWFSAHIKEAKSGEPLEYDTRLGLTKPEYEEYLREARKRHLEPSGRILNFTFKKSGDVLSLKMANTDSPLARIRIDLQSEELTASVGTLGKALWMSNDDPNTAIGPFDSYHWFYEVSDADYSNIRLCKLDIYRLKDTGKILWSFKDAKMVQKEITSNFEILFQHAPADSIPNEKLAKPEATNAVLKANSSRK